MQVRSQLTLLLQSSWELVVSPCPCGLLVLPPGQLLAGPRWGEALFCCHTCEDGAADGDRSPRRWLVSPSCITLVNPGS